MWIPYHEGSGHGTGFFAARAEAGGGYGFKIIISIRIPPAFRF